MSENTSESSATFQKHSELLRMPKNTPEHTWKSWNGSKPSGAFQNILKPMRMPQSASECLQTPQNIREALKIILSLPELLKIYDNTSQYLRTPPRNLLEPLRTYQTTWEDLKKL